MEVRIQRAIERKLSTKMRVIRVLFVKIERVGLHYLAIVANDVETGVLWNNSGSLITCLPEVGKIDNAQNRVAFPISGNLRIEHKAGFWIAQHQRINRFYRFAVDGDLNAAFQELPKDLADSRAQYVGKCRCIP